MEFPEAYVRRMLANTLVSSKRRAWIGEQPVQDLPESPGESAEVSVIDRSLLWPLICALPARQRAVIVLRYYEDLSEAEIAGALGCAPGTVKSQSSAAIKALKRAFAASQASGKRWATHESRDTNSEQCSARRQRWPTQPDPTLTACSAAGRSAGAGATSPGSAASAAAVVLVGGGIVRHHPDRWRRRRGLEDRGQRRPRPPLPIPASVPLYQDVADGWAAGAWHVPDDGALLRQRKRTRSRRDLRRSGLGSQEQPDGVRRQWRRLDRCL